MLQKQQHGVLAVDSNIIKESTPWQFPAQSLREYAGGVN